MTQYKSPRNTVFECFSHTRRRHILSVLEDQSRAVSETDLAARVAARENDVPPEEVADARRRRVRVSLRHNHLPKLIDGGLVERTPDGNVSTTTHPALEDVSLRKVLHTGERAGSRDALFDALSHADQRAVLAILEQLDGSVEEDELAARVVARDREASWREIPIEDVDRMRQQLRHHHLPKLLNAGLLSRSDEGEMIVYEGHPDLRSRWLAADADGVERNDRRSNDTQPAEAWLDIVNYT